jgi:hypothetical protein
VSSKAEPASAEMRWLEQAQHDMDLLVIDEADAVQRVLDTRLVQTEQLVATENGWSHRMAGYTNDALAGLAMAPAADPDVQEWHEHLQIHQQAVFPLNRLALDPGARQLRSLLGDSTFTAHSRLRQAARMLHGLPRRGEGDKSTEDAAEDFYQKQLQDPDWTQDEVHTILPRSVAVSLIGPRGRDFRGNRHGRPRQPGHFLSVTPRAG